MTVHTVTLELPAEVYERAEQIAQATRCPIEQVVAGWIRPPSETEIVDTLIDLENLSNEQLIQIAKTSAPLTSSRRLQELLAAQQQRSLTESEQLEAVTLVEQEDLVTL